NNIVTSDTRSIFLNTVDSTPEKKCINCGLCNQKCPVGLNPKYLKEHKDADRSKCINCGLCSYICPSKINFKAYLGGNHGK
ncbi:MAG: 4Fe-4S binding protein, partial [Bacilli bacterium]|nr:4Fe-4S binding protein [Bacilli bacterium]